MGRRVLLVICALLFTQPEVSWGLRGLVNLYGASSSSSPSQETFLSNPPEVELESVEKLTCPVSCAQRPTSCLAYALRPTRASPHLYTCRLFNRTDLVTLEQASDDVRTFTHFILIWSKVIEPEVTATPMVDDGKSEVTKPPPLGNSQLKPEAPPPLGSSQLQPEAPPTLLVVNGSSYYASYRVQNSRIVREELVTWAQAAANCTQMGLKLISIESAAEQEVVNQVINSTSEGGQTGLSSSYEEFWTSGSCPSTGPCTWGPNATRSIDQQDYTNWLTSGAPAQVSLDTMYRNQWRRRPGNALIWYLCDDGLINQSNPRTTQLPTTNSPRSTTANSLRSTTANGNSSTTFGHTGHRGNGTTSTYMTTTDSVRTTTNTPKTTTNIPKTTTDIPKTTTNIPKTTTNSDRTTTDRHWTTTDRHRTTTDDDET